MRGGKKIKKKKFSKNLRSLPLLKRVIFKDLKFVAIKSILQNILYISYIYLGFISKIRIFD